MKAPAHLIAQHEGSGALERVTLHWPCRVQDLHPYYLTAVGAAQILTALLQGGVVQELNIAVSTLAAEAVELAAAYEAHLRVGAQVAGSQQHLLGMAVVHICMVKAGTHQSKA